MFLALALIASLNGYSMPPTLLGVSIDLAAWDISRFRARTAGETAPMMRASMEAHHLHLLAVTTSAGFLIALPPVFIHLTLPFVIVCLLVLLALLMLWQSMRSLRTALDRPGQPPSR